MNGFYYIDKPLNITSFDIIRNLRKKLNIKRLWHTWTLDPLATWGVLLAVWNYTKLIPYFEKDTKEYEFVINLDWVTESFDLAENVQYISDLEKIKYKKDLNIDKINKILKDNFTWLIKQLPPKYSALKINWKKACDLMRQWKDVELKEREVTISQIEILDYNYPKLKLKAEVSAWTYIRSIAADLWELIWTGWYISFLRRTKIWKLDISLSQKLEDFDKNRYLDIEDLFSNKEFITLEDSILKKIDNWLKITWKFDFDINKELFIINNNQVTNIVIYDWEQLIPKKKIL